MFDGDGGGRRWQGPSRSAQVKALKESVKTGHITGLPDRLLRLFDARDAPSFEKPKPRRRPKLPYTGIGLYVKEFAEPGDTEYEPPAPETRPAEPRKFRNRELAIQVRLDVETKPEKDDRLREWKTEKAKQDIEQKAATYDPNKDTNIEGDPFKTLFVARLPFEVTERKLAREFEEFGPIKSIRIVQDPNTGKPRGYAFIEYESKKDMKEAYKMADGRKLEGRRLLVDVERGRTVENWRPMRLGGGLGADSRAPRPSKKQIQAMIARGEHPPPMPGAGPPMGLPDRGPPRMDSRGPPPPRDFDRGPPRDFRDRPPPRDFDRPRPDRYDRDRGGGGGYDRRSSLDRPPYGDRGGDRGGFDKRRREPSPRRERDRDDYKRSRSDY